jgi:uncharacterized delta-60 repeat protein
MHMHREHKATGKVSTSLSNKSANAAGRGNDARSRLSAAIQSVLNRPALFERLENRTMLSVSPAGSLDKTFNTTGIVSNSISAFNDEAVALVQSNGNLVAVGDSPSNATIELAAYNPDGSPNLSFGSSGFVQQPVTGFVQAYAATTDSAGDIFVAGTISNAGTGFDMAVVEFSPNGTLVTGFGTGGVASVDFNHKSDSGNAILVDPNTGNIVVAGGGTVAGSSGREELAIATLNSTTGSFVAETLTPVGASGNDQVNSIVMQGSDYVVGGYATTGGAQEFALARYNSSLGLDGSFGSVATPGIVTTSLGSGGSEVSGIALDSDGTLLATGSAGGSAALANYSATGTFNASYVAPSGSGFAQANGIAIQYDGKIVLTGYYNSGAPGAVNEVEVARLTKAGSGGSTTLTPDTTFGSSGYVTTPYSVSSTPVDAQANAVAIDSTGRIVVAGTASVNASALYPEDFTVARYQSNSAPSINSATVSLDATPELATTGTTPVADSGDLVSALIAQSPLGYTDTDPGAKQGMAVTAVDNTYGQWYYSTDGSTWTPILSSSVSPTSALLLTPSTYVQFVPDQYFNTDPTAYHSQSQYYAVPPAFTFKAWDQTTGTASTNSTANYYDSTNINDGYDAFSSNSATASVVVSSVNQPPAVSTTNTGVTSVVGVPAPINGISLSDIDSDPANPSDAETLTVSVGSGNALSMTGANLTFTGLGTSTLTAKGTLNALNTALSNGDLTYTAATIGTGSDTVSLSLNDNGSTGGGAQTSSTKTIAVTVQAVPSTVWVNASFAGSAFDQQVGTAPDSTPELFGVNAFATIQGGVNAVVSGGTVNVAAGTYTENVTINKPVQLLGAYAGTAGAAASGNSPTRLAGSESEVLTNGNQSAVFTISSDHVTINGFYIEGNDTGVVGGTLTSGVNTNATYAVLISGAHSNLNVENNVIKDVAVGFYGSGTAASNLINQNWFDSIGVYDYGYAVTLRTNFYADVTNNLMTRVQSGIQTNNFSGAVGPASWFFSGNTISAYGAGIWDNLQYNQASPLTIDGNTITSLAVPNISANTLSGATANSNGHTIGILLVSIQDAVSVTITNNSVSGMAYGVTLFNTTTSSTITLDGTNSISNNGVGVYLTNIVQYNPVTTTVLGGSANNPTATGTADLTGLMLTGNTTGVLVYTSNPDTTDGVSLTLGSGDTISGGTTGLEVSGALASIAGDSLSTTAFTSPSGNYITLADGALAGQTLDATGVSFDTYSRSSLSDMYAVEDKITDYLDDSTLGYVKLNAGNVFVTQMSDSVQRGINIASSGDTVNVQAGTYIENLNITEPIILSGANAGIDPNTGMPVSASILLSAVDDTSLANAPGNQQAGTTPVIHVSGAGSGATISGFTIDGINNALNTSLSNAPGTIDSSTGVYLDQVSSVTLQDNTIQDFVHFAIIGIAGATLTPVSTGSVISDNKIANVEGQPNYGYGEGIDLANNFYASIEGNYITAVRRGMDITNFYLANTGAEPAISGNYIDAGQLGIWFNLYYESATGFGVSGNTLTSTFTSETFGSSPDANHAGLFFSSFTGIASSVLTVSGNNIGGQYDAGVLFWNNTGTDITVSGGTINASGGTVDGSGLGVAAVRLETSNTYYGAAQPGTGTLTLDSVTILDAATGVAVDDNLGIAGTNVSVGFTGTTSISGGTTGLSLDGTGAEVTGNTLGSLAFSAQSGNYITLADGALAGQSLDATGVSFDTYSRTSVTDMYAVEDKITDYLDDPTLGYVKLKSGNVYVAHGSEMAMPGAIQRGINVAVADDVVNIESGAFVNNVDIPLGVTITGAGQGLTFVYPATSNPTGGSLGSPVFLIDSNNVTIQNLTVDGENPNLADGIDASSGIVTDWSLPVSLTGMTVKNVTVQNVYERGIEYSDGQDYGTGTADIENDTVTSVQGGSESIGIFSFGGSGTIANNTISNTSEAISTNWSNGTKIYGNSITVGSSDAGVDSSNNGGLGGVGDEIYSNTIMGADGSDSTGIDVFAPYVAESVHDNTISGVGTGLIDYGSQAVSVPNVTFTHNSVDLTGVTNGVGVLVTSSLVGYGYGDAQATLVNNTITNATVGVQIQIDPSDTTGDTVSANVSGGSITAPGGTGILVSGSNASASIGGVIINDPTYGIEISGGTASVSSNTIENNDVGVFVTAGGSISSLGGNIFSGNTTDLDIDNTAGAVTDGGGNAFTGAQYINDYAAADTLNVTGDSFSGADASALSPTARLRRGRQDRRLSRQSALRLRGTERDKCLHHAAERVGYRRCHSTWCQQGADAGHRGHPRAVPMPTRAV